MPATQADGPLHPEPPHWPYLVCDPPPPTAVVVEATALVRLEEVDDGEVPALEGAPPPPGVETVEELGEEPCVHCQ